MQTIIVKANTHSPISIISTIRNHQFYTHTNEGGKYNKFFHSALIFSLIWFIFTSSRNQAANLFILLFHILLRERTPPSFFRQKPDLSHCPHCRPDHRQSLPSRRVLSQSFSRVTSCSDSPQ